MIYDYVAEDDAGIDSTQAHEKNRVGTANHYLKRIRYGNRTPNRDEDWRPTDPALLPQSDWMFEVLFDYGEGHYRRLTPPGADPVGEWPRRQDPFSSYRAGFEVRTRRLCRRVLIFHHFPDELGQADTLVRGTHFEYLESPIASFISRITQSGYVRQNSGA